MAILYKNNAVSALASSITNVATSMSVTAGQGALFPTISGSDYFYVTIISFSNPSSYEIVKVTARSTDTFTIVRAQDGTTAAAWSANDRVELRITNALLSDALGERALVGGTNATGTWPISVSGNAATVTSITSGQVTTALGYTPYNATNPNGYITSASLSSYLPLSGGTLTGASTVSVSTWEKWTLETTGVTAKARQGSDANGLNFTSNARWTGSAWAEDDTGKKKFAYIQHLGNGRHEFRTAASGSGISWTVSLTVDETAVNSTVALTQSGNQVLHAGNYTSYSPSLTGSGASGSWGISITGNAATVSGISAGQFFNNMGNNHSTYQDFNNVPGFGAYYVQQGGNSPTGTGSHQWYGFTLGLGNDYALSSYATQLYWPRRAQNSDTYIYVRDREAGSWTSWAKIKAGYADSAGSATDSTKLPLTGGQLTGQVEFRSANQLTFSDGANTMRGFIKSLANTGTGAAGLVIATSGGESIVFKDGNADSGDINFVIRGDGVLLQGGSNALLHAGNYTSYSPSLTGSGASGTWGISITGSAASAGSASSATTATVADRLSSYDHRIKAPNSDDASRARFGFTSWANNNTAPWADYIHLRSYTDSSGGSDNLIMFNKSTPAMRIWQQAWGSSTAYASYVDVLTSGNYSSYALPLSGGTISGAIRASQITAGGSTNTDANLGVQGTTHLTGTIYYGGTVGNVNSWSSISTSSSGTHTFSGSRFIFDRVGYGSQPLIDMQSSSITFGQPAYAGSGITVNSASAAGIGINLYSGSPSSPTYGLFFAQTGNFGTYGAVSADWATYFTMNSTANRGWIFREVESLGNVAAISNQGNMTLRSHFEQGNNIARPNVSWSAGSTSTGMVIFYLPGTTSNYGMVHMVFDIYEYNGNAVSTVIVGGHNWSTSWYNVSANVVGQCGKEVRLGCKDGRFCVVFGTSGSTWEYGTIVLRKIHNGSFYDNVMDMVGNWSATQTTTESFTNITGDLRALRTPASFNAGGAITQAGNQVLHAGNYTSYSPSLGGSGATGTWGISISGNASTASQVGGYTSDGWLRKVGDSTQFQIYGNSRTMVFRTDGVTNPHGGGGYPYIWFYGGSGDSERRMILNTDGQLWTNYYGWLQDYFLPKSGGTMSGSLSTPAGTAIYLGSQNVSTSSRLIINWHTDGDYNYLIGKRAGSWAQPMDISFYTGLRYHAHQAYGGHKFYTSGYDGTQAFSVGDGDANVRVYNNLYVSGESRGYDVYTTGGWFRNHTNNNGIYWSVTGWHLYPASSSDFYVRSGTDGGTLRFLRSDGTTYGYLHWASDRAMGFLTDGGSWRFRVDNSGNARCYNNLYLDQNHGHGIVGVYSSYRYQGVFAMGDSYKLPADGTTTGSLYGMAWSHPNAGGVAGNLDSHGMLVLINGGFGSCMSYSIRASGNVTAYSDERLKTNWRPMPESFVERLAAVKVGIYDRTDGERMTQVGVSAQSLQKLLPEAITKAGDEMGTLSVSYGNAAMASAVELAKEIVKLRMELDELKSKLN